MENDELISAVELLKNHCKKFRGYKCNCIFAKGNACRIGVIPALYNIDETKLLSDDDIALVKSLKDLCIDITSEEATVLICALYGLANGDRTQYEKDVADDLRNKILRHVCSKIKTEK